MKKHELSYRFYILFVLILSTPAALIAEWFHVLLDTLLSPFNPLVTSGVIEAPTAVVVLGVFFVLYERWVWRIPPFSFMHPPYIGGRYEGQVTSSYDGKDYTIAFEIHQTLLKTTVCLYTERSASYSVIAETGINENSNECLTYVYRNTPRTVTDDLDMKAHYGMAMLEYFPDLHTFKGFYFNDPRDRGRHGTLECKHVSRVTKKRFGA